MFFGSLICNGQVLGICLLAKKRFLQFDVASGALLELTQSRLQREYRGRMAALFPLLP